MFGILAKSLFIASRQKPPKRWQAPDHWREAEMTGPFDARHILSSPRGGRG